MGVLHSGGYRQFTAIARISMQVMSSLICVGISGKKKLELEVDTLANELSRAWRCSNYSRNMILIPSPNTSHNRSPNPSPNPNP